MDSSGAPRAVWTHTDVPALARFDAFDTIDWMADSTEPKRRTSSVFPRSSSRTTSWLVLVAMGVAIGLIAAALNIATAWLAGVRVGRCRGNLYLPRHFCCWNQTDSCPAWLPWLPAPPVRYAVYVAWLAVLAAAAAVLVRRYAPAAAGLGISEIKCIVAGFRTRGFLGARTLAIKGLALPLAIASGLSLGKEGPSVHYAVAVGNVGARLVGVYRRHAEAARGFLVATLAAGVAVAFGSPMGGVAFALEEIAPALRWRDVWKAYICALVAVATLAALNPLRTGQLVVFEVTYDAPWHAFELPVYAVLGVFGGCYGVAVARFNRRVAGFRRRHLAPYAVREAVVLAVALAAICYGNDFLRLDMTETMQSLFAECHAGASLRLCSAETAAAPLFASLVLATVVRSALTVVTYGCKVPAGIFVPSMAAGATFGRAVGVAVEAAYRRWPDLAVFSACTGDRCIIPGTYAFIGAGAALSGITHLTVTVAIIMFELTGAVRYIIPTMVAVAVTKMVNDRWGAGGIADQMIVFNGLPFIDPKDEHVFGARADAAMTTTTTVFAADETYDVADVRRVVAQTRYRGFPVVLLAAAPRIVGWVGRLDLEAVGESAQQCVFGKPDPLHSGQNGQNIQPSQSRQSSLSKQTGQIGQNGQKPHDTLVRSDLDDFRVRAFGAGAGAPLNLAPLVNTSPLVVSADTTLEYLLDLFVRLGPRHVLVEKDGVLAGIITRKDMLRYEHTVHWLHTPHEDDTLDLRVWALFQRVGAALRGGFRSVGMERIAAAI